jgi:hypothetical protein
MDWSPFGSPSIDQRCYGSVERIVDSSKPNVSFPPIAVIDDPCDDCPVHAKRSDWLGLGLSLLGYATAIIALG